MKEVDNSWEFLSDFYLIDSSIIDLINRALSIKSKVTIRSNTFDEMMSGLLSLIPKESIPSYSYRDILWYVTPNDCLENIKKEEGISEIENAFLRHVWDGIYKHSSAESLFSKDIIEHGVKSEYKPYLILHSLGISVDWFLYGGKSAFCFVDEKENLEKLFNGLKKGYSSWMNPWHFLSKLANLSSKLFHSQQLSPEQLYPLMTLLIVLKYEWDNSFYEDYLIQRCDALIKYETLDTKSITARIAAADKVRKKLIYILYNKFDFADKSLIREFEGFLKQEDNKIAIHPLIAKHIFDSKAFRCLFKFDSDENGNEISDVRISYYKNVENKLGENYSGKRLLVDYLFPYTQIRENDVFILSKNITNKVYLSLMKGELCKKHWIQPNMLDKKDELFDYIQIEPNEISSGVYRDNRVFKYRDNLKPEGSFLFVRSENEDIITEKINTAFSNYRHDLQKLQEGSEVKNLQNELNSLNKSIKMIFNTLNNIVLFLNNPIDSHFFNAARDSIKNLENDSDIPKNILIDSYLNNIHKIRDLIEDYSYSNSAELLKEIPRLIKNVKLNLMEVLISSLPKFIERANDIDDSYDSLFSYIETIGVTNIRKNDTIPITDFLNRYIKHYTTLDKKRAYLSLEPTLIDSNYTITYNKALLRVMLDSIIDNAYKHGFENYNCEDPQIRLILKENADYLILKICNNGRPIEINNKDYKTRGVFKGPTGHTGLGGYLISKNAEKLGGYIELPQKKDWNTEVHLYIKK